MRFLSNIGMCNMLTDAINLHAGKKFVIIDVGSKYVQLQKMLSQTDAQFVFIPLRPELSRYDVHYNASSQSNYTVGDRFRDIQKVRLQDFLLPEDCRDLPVVTLMNDCHYYFDQDIVQYDSTIFFNGFFFFQRRGKYELPCDEGVVNISQKERGSLYVNMIIRG